MKRAPLPSGFTLIELIATLVVMSILTALTLQVVGPINETAKVEDTKSELNELALAIAGNPAITTNGERGDFGFVGDVGALPNSLNDLLTSPGGYATWNGPYVKNEYSSWTSDITTDSWDVAYVYSSDSARVSSTGSGTTIIRQFAVNKAALVINKIVGTVVDQNGTPPGQIYRDSVSVRLTIPNGTGSTITKTRLTDLSGNFSFDSIPIGRQKLEVIYMPAFDSLTRYVTVVPGSQVTTTIRLNDDYWNVYSP